MDPLNREIEVLVGPLPDWRGGGDREQAVRFFGDGTPDNLRIKFNIQKHMVSTASPSTISLYNLGAPLRNTLVNTKGAKIVVSVGWSNVGLVQIFTGGLLNCVSKREGADIVTNLIFLAGYGAKARSISSETFNAGATVRSAVEKLAAGLEGASVDKKNIKLRDYKIGSQGWSFVGATTDGLDKLARSYGFSWWIDQDSFHAVDDLDALDGGAANITSQNGFLKRAEPMLTSPFQQQQGVSVDSLFNPLVDVGRIINVESDLNPGITGSYKVHQLTHNGDTHSTSWDTSLESYTYGL